MGIAYIDSAASSNFITAALVRKSDTDKLDADGLRVETAMEGEAVMRSLGRGSFSAGDAVIAQWVATRN